MAQEDFISKLATLSNRQRAVLRLRCQGMDYRSIGRELNIKVGTVKSTMAAVYIKLGLEWVANSERHKVLFQEACPALESEALPEPPPESKQESHPPKRVMKMVEADERALMVVETGSLVAPVRSVTRRAFPLVALVRMLGIILVIALGVFGALAAYRSLFGGDLPELAQAQPGEPPAASSTPRPAQQQPQPTSQKATQRPTNTARPANTPRPTSTSRPTNTPRPQPTATPVGMMDIMVQVDGEETDMKDSERGPASTSSWIASGVYLQDGDRLTITYESGEWWIGYLQDDTWYPQTPTDADGYTEREEDRVVAAMGADNPNVCYELRSAPIASLIGRVEKSGPIFFIGNTYDEVVTQTGNLYLRMNYNSPVGFGFHTAGQCPTANGGSVNVRVQVTPP